MASRFFYGSDSESSSSGEEEDVYDHSEEEDSEAEDSGDESTDSGSEESDDDGKTGVNKFLRDAADSEESEDEEKVTIVKSAKDKRLEALENTIKLIENAQKISDWSVISTGEFTLAPADMAFLRDMGNRGGMLVLGDGAWRLTMGFRRVRQPQPPDRQG
jgi:hypothetical protein